MPNEQTTIQGVRSRASVLGHPIHPMLIPFPIAFLPGALVSDVAYVFTKSLFWAEASFWLVAAGFITGVLAAVFGLIDFVSIRRAREHRAGWIHLLGNVAALSLGLVNWLVRSDDPAGAIIPSGLILSLMVTLLLVVTGWYGGELAYRHGIGVSGHSDSKGDGPERP